MQIPRPFTSAANTRIPDVSSVGGEWQADETISISQQWMFVTDTIDAVYRPEDWSPESLIDQLAEMVADLPEPRVSIREHCCWLH